MEGRSILKKFRYDNIPVYPLTAVRRKYRDLFIKLINKKEIKLEHVNICSCGGNSFVNVAEQDRFGLPFGNKSCKDCGLLITSPRVSEESLPLYYNKIYHPLIVGTEYGEVASRYSFSSNQGDKIFDYCCTRIGELSNSQINILEIGCAAGANLVSLENIIKNKLNKDCSLYGIEYEESVIKKAQESNIDVFSGLDAAVDSNIKYDIIVLSHVFEHFVDLNKSLEIIRKLLNSNGFIRN